MKKFYRTRRPDAAKTTPRNVVANGFMIAEALLFCAVDAEGVAALPLPLPVIAGPLLAPEPALGSPDGPAALLAPDAPVGVGVGAAGPAPPLPCISIGEAVSVATSVVVVPSTTAMTVQAAIFPSIPHFSSSMSPMSGLL